MSKAKKKLNMKRDRVKRLESAAGAGSITDVVTALETIINGSHPNGSSTPSQRVTDSFKQTFQDTLKSQIPDTMACHGHDDGGGGSSAPPTKALSTHSHGCA